MIVAVILLGVIRRRESKRTMYDRRGRRSHARSEISRFIE